MKIISVYNIKGGVGKTAAAVNLAYLAAEEGHATLICDMDPQGSATFYFRVEPGLKKPKKSLLKGGKPLNRNLKSTDYMNLHLLPSDFILRKLDILLNTQNKPRKTLKKSLAPLIKDYDYIFIDCPPNITLASEAVFRASDYILVPIIPTTLSRRTYEKLVDFFRSYQLDVGRILPFFSMVEKRKKLHREMMQQMRAEYLSLLQTTIPYSSIVECMGIQRAPVPLYAGNSVPARAYAGLWLDVKKKIS